MRGQGEEQDEVYEPHPRRYRRRAIGFYFLALVVMVATLGGFLLDQYRQEIRAGFERTRARADLVAEWVTSTFVASDLTLVGIAQLLDHGIAPDRLSALLAQRRDSLDVVDEMSLVDGRGRVTASSSPARPPGLDLGDAPVLRHFLEAPGLHHLVTPLHRASEGSAQRILHLHRLPGGVREAGPVAVVQLDPTVFGQTLGQLGMTKGESIAIIDTGMTLIARRPVFTDGDPLDVLGTAISEPLTEAFLASGDAVTQVRTESPLDGRERLYTFQRVGELPFVAVVGEETGVMLAGWRLRLGILGGIGLVVALLGGLVLRHYLNRLRFEDALRAHVAEREQARQETQAREARLQALVGSIQDMIYVIDARGRFVYVHAVDESHLKHAPAGVLQHHYREVLPDDVAKAFDRVLAEVHATDQPVEFDYRLVAAGEPRDFHAVVSPLAESGGGYDGVLAVIRDVTQSRATEAQLRIAATAFETHLGMMITDAEGHILKVNRTFTRITGYREDEVLGHRPSLLSSGRHDAFFYQRLWTSVAQSGSWEGEIWNRRKNGDIYPEWLTISAVRNAAGELTHHVATLSDISERKAAEREIHQLAFFDPLTGLPNRRLMLDRLDGALKDTYRSKRFGALLSIDLDHFKQVNDTQGHYQGDQLLQQIARRLEAVLRDTDTLARLSGDEFAVLLNDLGADPEDVATRTERIAQKLLGVLQQAIPVGGEMHVVTGSIGIALFQNHAHDTTIDEILQQADMALYQAKTAGRNTLSFFDPAIQERMQARVRLENDLRLALPRGEFRLHYQRQLDAVGATTGVEALLRWEHPQRGMVSPGEFIPLAEESRLIVAIGDWVMETACHQLVAWADDPAKGHLRISVNVSPRQFREADFVERVTAILARTGAPATRLELEVTESLFVEDRDDARGKMLRLKALGVTFALDDFGTGYSSLSYLKRLPLDRLKIDQSFVRDLHDDEASASIVASTIALSSSLQLEVIAEGVETRAQHGWLLAHGCQAFQGFLFCRPVPVEALTFDLSPYTV